MYELYKYNNSLNVRNKINLDMNLRLSIRRITVLGILKSNHIIYDLYWLINTLGGCWVYSVLDGNNEVHYSYVTKKCMKFPFMKRDDIQIGNCYTDKNYRGLGIYPFVIQSVINTSSLVKENSEVFMLIEEDNISSQKGILKVGFLKIGALKIKKLLGLIKIYKLI